LTVRISDLDTNKKKTNAYIEWDSIIEWAKQKADSECEPILQEMFNDLIDLHIRLKGE
jgi:hypothetical protein